MGRPIYTVRGRYIRIRETGAVFPVHPEQLKLVKKDLADLVEWNGSQFIKVELGELPKEAPVKISTPARRPEPQTPSPGGPRTFAPPSTESPIEIFDAPAISDPVSTEAALAAAAAAAPGAPATPVDLPKVTKVDLVIPSPE